MVPDGRRVRSRCGERSQYKWVGFREKGTNVQDNIHLVHGETLGLRQEEEGPQGRHNHPRGEEEPRRVAERAEDVRKRLRDGKLGRPNNQGGIGSGEVAQRAGEDLSRDDPRNTVEPERPADGVDHDHARGRPATRGGRGGELLAGGDNVRRVADLDVRADDPEAERADEGRDDGGPAAAEQVDEEDEVDDGRDGLDEAVDAGVERDVRDADGREEGRGVVIDGGGTGEVVEGEGAEDENEAVPHALAAERAGDTTEVGPLAGAVGAGDGGLFVHLLLEHVDFLLHVCLSILSAVDRVSEARRNLHL